jgi:hypothetical protein
VIICVTKEGNKMRINQMPCLSPNIDVCDAHVLTADDRELCMSCNEELPEDSERSIAELIDHIGFVEMI